MPKPTNTECVDYLKDNLIAVLQTNSGGKHVPRVWLTKDEDGTVRKTTIEPNEDDGIGGIQAPFFVYERDKVFTPKRSGVVEFLRHFNLSEPEAFDIIDTIGMWP